MKGQISAKAYHIVNNTYIRLIKYSMWSPGRCYLIYCTPKSEDIEDRLWELYVSFASYVERLCRYYP